MREGMRESPDLPDRNARKGALPQGPTEIIVLGFDFGMRRIGVALGNGITRIARPLRVVTSGPSGAPALWRELGALVEHWLPHQLVVGVARHPDGTAHEMTQRCERFARQLEGRFRLPVARVDERYSSAVLEAGADTDDHAAAVILQQWFDANMESAAEPGLEPASESASEPGLEPAAESASEYEADPAAVTAGGAPLPC